MILIWDNGMDYSSHDIDFIELGDVSVDVATTLLRMHDDGGRVLGTAEHIEWRRGAIGNLIDHVAPWFELSKAEDVPKELCDRILEHEEKRIRDLLVTAKGTQPWTDNLKRSLAECTETRIALASRR